MTERELRNLSRSDLLELLIHQSKQVQILQDKLTQAQAALESRQITINQAGSIADAALQLNGVFEAAQAASQQYMDNIKQLSDRQASVCAQLEEESREKAEQYLAKARKNASFLEDETKKKCAEMIAKAKAESEALWQNTSKRLETLHTGFASTKEVPPSIQSKNEQE